MKRLICTVLLLMAVLTGCAKGAREFNGEILAFNHVDGDGEVYSFRLQRQDGKEFEIFLREDTSILSRVDTMDHREFREGGHTGLQVNVEYEKISGCYMARSVHINGQRFESAMALEDGTRIDVVEKMFGSRDYCLEDGTVLLHERDRVGPENMGGAAFSFDDLNGQVQEKVLAYYDAMEPRYDLGGLLEQAYDKWYILNNNREEFTGDTVSCDIYPSAANEKLVFYGSEIWMPGENGNEILREGAVFDRETGEWISSFDLFTCDEQALLDAVFELTRLDDERLMEEIRGAISPENILFEPEGISLWFSAEELPGHGLSHGTAVPYQEGIGHLMHPWAVPDSEEK